MDKECHLQERMNLEEGVRQEGVGGEVREDEAQYRKREDYFDRPYHEDAGKES